MTRSRGCTLDVSIEKHLKDLLQQQQVVFEMGLMLGQSMATLVRPKHPHEHDLIVGLVATPDEEEGVAATGLRDVSTDWVVTHASQIERMLPGGLDILGLYVVSNQDAITIFKMCTSYIGALNAEALAADIIRQKPMDIPKYVLHFSPDSSKFTLKSFHNSNTGMESLPSELRWQDLRNRLIKYHTITQIDQHIHLTKGGEVNMNDLENDFERRVEDLKACLREYLCRYRCVVGRICKDDNKVQLFTSVKNQSSPKRKTFEGKGIVDVVLKGDVYCYAYVHEKEATNTDAIVSYIKTDFVRSVVERVNLLIAEEWNYLAEQGNASGIQLLSGGSISLPGRHLCCWPGVGMQQWLMTLYASQQETVSDAYARARDLLCLSNEVNTGLLQFQDVETYSDEPSPQQVDAKRDSFNASSTSEPVVERNSSESKAAFVSPCFILVGLVILLLGILARRWLP